MMVMIFRFNLGERHSRDGTQGGEKPCLPWYCSIDSVISAKTWLMRQQGGLGWGESGGF